MLTKNKQNKAHSQTKPLENCSLGYNRKCDEQWKTDPFKTRWSRKVFRIFPIL